jgi:hypothetical protein
LEKRLGELGFLITDEKARAKYMVAEIKKIGVRYGEKRRSELIDVPESPPTEKSSFRATAPISKPYFLKIDIKKGVVEPTKGPKGAILLEKTSKLVTLTQDGILRKISPTFKGPLGEGYSSVLLAKKETEVEGRSYLVVFTLDSQLKAMTLSGEDLIKTTSKGKQVLPDGATLVFFGEGSYVIPWASSRKKKLELSPATTKQGKPRGKGIKIAALSEISL